MGQNIFTTQVPSGHNVLDSGVNYTLGTLFSSDVGGQINGIRWWTPVTGGQPGRRCGLYRRDTETTGTLLASADFVTAVNDAWNSTLFAAPVPIVAGQLYIAVLFTPNYYTFTGSLLLNPIANGHLTAPATTAGQGNGRFHSSPNLTDLTFPESNYNGNCYFVDVDFTPAGGATAQVSESVTVADTATRTLAQPRTVADTVTVADTATRTLAQPRTVADTVTFADSVRSGVTSSTPPKAAPHRITMTVRPASVSATVTPASVSATGTSTSVRRSV